MKMTRSLGVIAHVCAQDLISFLSGHPDCCHFGDAVSAALQQDEWLRDDEVIWSPWSCRLRSMTILRRQHIVRITSMNDGKHPDMSDSFQDWKPWASPMQLFGYFSTTQQTSSPYIPDCCSWKGWLRISRALMLWSTRSWTSSVSSLDFQTACRIIGIKATHGERFKGRILDHVIHARLPVEIVNDRSALIHMITYSRLHDIVRSKRTSRKCIDIMCNLDLHTPYSASGRRLWSHCSFEHGQSVLARHF